MPRGRYPGVTPLKDENGRPIRGKYRIRFEWKDAKTGDTHEYQGHVTGTAEQARDERERLKAERRAARTGPPKVRLEDWAELWLERESERGNVRASTTESRTSELEVRVLSRLGRHYIPEIEVADIEGLVDFMLGAEYAPDTINQTLRTLGGCLQAFYKAHGMQCLNPAREVKKLVVPKRRKDDPNSLSFELVPVFLDACRARHLRWYTFAFLGFMTGMRPGELAALRWEDLDEHEGVVHVRRTWSRGLLEPPKADYEREPPYTAPMIEVVKEWRRALVAEQHPGLAGGFVFPARPPALAADAGWMSRTMTEIAEAAKIPFRFTGKGLRRTHNNLCRQAGIDHLVIRATIGHTTEEMTETYATVDRREQRKAVATLHRRIEAAKKGSDT